MTGVRKETVIGHVPASWDIKSLAEVSDFITKVEHQRPMVLIGPMKVMVFHSFAVSV